MFAGAVGRWVVNRVTRLFPGVQARSIQQFYDGGGSTSSEFERSKNVWIGLIIILVFAFLISY